MFGPRFAVLSVLSSFEIILVGSTSGLLYSIFLTSYDCLCFMSLPRSVMGWSAVYDCGVSG